jgi:hypothetical protein
MPFRSYVSSRFPTHLRARDKLRELAHDAVFWGFHHSDTERDYHRRRGNFDHFCLRPGAMVKRLPTEARLLLKHLRSEDFVHDRPLESPVQITFCRPGRVYKIPGTCAERQG